MFKHKIMNLQYELIIYHFVNMVTDAKNRDLLFSNEKTLLLEARLVDYNILSKRNKIIELRFRKWYISFTVFVLTIKTEYLKYTDKVLLENIDITYYHATKLLEKLK